MLKGPTEPQVVRENKRIELLEEEVGYLERAAERAESLALRLVDYPGAPPVSSVLKANAEASNSLVRRMESLL